MGFDFIEAAANCRMDTGGGNRFDLAGTQFLQPPFDFFIPRAFDLRADKIIHSGHQHLGEFHTLFRRELRSKFPGFFLQCYGHGATMPESKLVGKPVHFFNNAYSIESTNACKLASMMFSLTPTVPHSRLPSLDVMSTRV